MAYTYNPDESTHMICVSEILYSGRMKKKASGMRISEITLNEYKFNHVEKRCPVQRLRHYA